MRDKKNVIAVVIVAVMILITGKVFGGVETQKKSLTTGAAEALGELVHSEPVISVKAYDMKLRALGELTTGELTYDGLVEFEEGKIPLITKHSFLMTYSSTVRAGIDFSEVRIRESGDTWVVTVPHAQIQTITIDPNSLSFYDNKKALIMGDEKEDTREALIAAEANVKEMADLDKLVRLADEQVECMVYQVLGDVSGQKQIRVEWR